MNLTSKSQLTAHAIACGIGSNEANILAASVIQAINDYHDNSRRGAYQPSISQQNSELHEKLIVGQVIVQQKNQRRLKSIIHPKPVVGRPSNPSLKVLTSSLATAFTHAGGRVTLNQEQETASPSAFHSFVKPIFEGLGLFNVRDYISDHMTDRKNP